jgi:hypothetical protein
MDATYFKFSRNKDSLLNACIAEKKFPTHLVLAVGTMIITHHIHKKKKK